MSEPAPYTIDVPQAKLDAIRQRVAAYPWSTIPDLDDWKSGPPLAFVRRVADHWLDRYDWRAAEGALNRFPQVVAEVDGVALHALHERGSGADPATVVLVHGWPSSVYDYLDLIEPLAHPERFGGDAEEGVNVVVPSLPGFGWSGPPPGPQGRRADAALVHKLVTDALGYERYVAGGGDFGAMIAGWLALDHPEAVRGIHITTPNLRPAGAPWMAPEPPADFTAEEKEYLGWEAGYLQERLTYATIQSSSPQTLAYAEMDSPVGQAAWIFEKLRRWTGDDGPDPDAVFGIDRMLTAAMAYLVTDSFATSLWAYPGVYLDPPTLEPGQRVEAPTALLAGKDPLVPVPPRRFVERVYNVAQWTDLPEAGHFAAFQHPDRVRDDLQRFLRLLRAREGSKAR